MPYAEDVKPLLVCGNANVETVFRLPDGEWPLTGGYVPGALSLNVSGVGANQVRALHALGSPVRCLTLAASDAAGQVIRATLEPLSERLVVAPTPATPQSLALIGPGGQHIFYRDLKTTFDAPAPFAEFGALAQGCAAVLMGNAAWTRDLLPLARERGLKLVCDVHDIAGLDNPYDQPYFGAADVLLLSAERLDDPGALMHALLERFPAELVVAGWGARGALLLERGQALIHQPAFPARVGFAGGAGDTLAAAFAHFYLSRHLTAPEAVRLACAAAALKLGGALELGAVGSGEGHPDEASVYRLAAP